MTEQKLFICPVCGKGTRHDEDVLLFKCSYCYSKLKCTENGIIILKKGEEVK